MEAAAQISSSSNSTRGRNGKQPLRVDTIASAAPTTAVHSSSLGGSARPASMGVNAVELPAHLRDHVVSMTTNPNANLASMEGELLPPIAPGPAPMRIPLLPENMKMEPTIGINNRPLIKRVIVCGAGIIGLTTCYYLAKQGHEVLCVEKEAGVGTQVSFCNGAFLDPALYASWADERLLRKGMAGDSSSSKKGHDSSAIFEQSTFGGDAVDETSTEVVDGPPADAAGTATSGPPSGRPRRKNSILVRRGSSGTIKWPAIGKPMKIEMSAFKDTKFWKWGLQFMMNSKAPRSNEHGRTIRELGFYSMLKLRELQLHTKKGELEMDQTAQGTIEVFRTSAAYDITMESDRTRHLEELGMELQPLTSTEAHNLEPTLRSEMFNSGALFSAFGTNGDVHKMCESLYRLCMREGVMFRFNTEVQHILTDKTSVIALQTRRGSLIEGDEFVLALGNSTVPVAKKAGLNLSIYPVKGYVLSVPVNERFPAPLHNVYAGGHALVSPLGRTLRISGGVDFSNPKKKNSNQKRFDWLLAQAKAIFPDGYLDVDKMQTHVCWRPVTADDVPLIGRTKIRNLYVNAGHGSKGWTLSFGSAALLADEISGLRPKLDMSKFDPHRFGFFG
uniref:FAD dependent oxidoreductase domain-containing protein n=1 Tax=Globisporangium ultimum (strain ATCC 200006 / CBS 805.95 / DAOM BR144) TaxID=431595 RepID=K3X0N3_GLOUD